jgi:hypothetical protein
MSEDQPAPKRRPWRMLFWMVIAPAAVLLLVLAGANWRFFHLAYCRHLLRSSDHRDRSKGMDMIFKRHLREGMSQEEVRSVLEPARLENLNPESRAAFMTLHVFGGPKAEDLVGALLFDKTTGLRLDRAAIMGMQRPPGPPWIDPPSGTEEKPE